ncbi:hypothetical protein JS756_30765 [Streptomyces actuosus]|uniref:SH3 domain-containing protein n=1 Tax=Streptomyces actuosus TaxID=1885 RepID=A0ABS2VZE9_STRAS|nr:hypothetical protein [Streptomyces actuosus]MBN0048409.1 hypothetical protein [Streptomyces actuosus]
MSSNSTARLFSLRALCATLLGLSAVLGLMSAPAQADITTSPVHIWASQVRVRQCASTTCGLASQEGLTNVTVQAFCQRWGDRVADGPYYNHYWVEIITPQGWLGWVSAVYVSGGSNDGPVPGVRVETDSGPVYCEYP